MRVLSVFREGEGFGEGEEKGLFLGEDMITIEKGVQVLLEAGAKCPQSPE